MAWAKDTTDTLGSAGDTHSLTLTPYKFFQFISHSLQSGAIVIRWRLGSSTIDTGSNYANRYADNGSASFVTSQTELVQAPDSSAYDKFCIYYWLNIATQEKLGIGWSVDTQTAGAGTAPKRGERASKWANTSNQADVAELANSGAGDFATGSNVTILGGDETETASLQDGTIFEETDTNKSYIWNATSQTWTQL
jgi:hypothetical protein